MILPFDPNRPKAAQPAVPSGDLDITIALIRRLYREEPYMYESLERFIYKLCDGGAR